MIDWSLVFSVFVALLVKDLLSAWWRRFGSLRRDWLAFRVSEHERSRPHQARREPSKEPWEVGE